jgi:cell division protein FtsW
MDAFANGNLLGRGPGEGVVKMSLPDVHTDFIFSLAGEEYGVWLTSIIVLCFGVIVVRTMTISMKENNLFQMYAASGLAASLGGQAIVNMCSALKLIPAKGMTLPFISYGGSSMLASCLCMGMLLAITRKNAVAEDKDNG